MTHWKQLRTQIPQILGVFTRCPFEHILPMLLFFKISTFTVLIKTWFLFFVTFLVSTENPIFEESHLPDQMS